MDLSEKVILVTGASRGIGRATALALAERGASVVLAARDAGALARAAEEASARGPRAHALPMDVTDEASVARGVDDVLKRFGRIDVAVNNAGVSTQGFVLDEPVSRARAQFEVNLWGAWHVARAVLPAMLARGEGTLVNVASVAGCAPYPSMAAYGASKGALLAFTRALRGEVAHRGVRVVEFVPGHTNNENARSVRLDGPTLQTNEQVAAALVRACERPRRRVVSGFPNRVFLFVNALSPWLGEGTMLAFARNSLPAAFTKGAGARAIPSESGQSSA